MLLQNKTSDAPKPLDIINIMQETKWLITKTQANIIDTYDWNSNAHEVYEFP